MKQLVKNLFFGILALPILGCNQIDFSKLSQNPIGSLGVKLTSSVPFRKITEKSVTTKKLDDIVAPTRTKLVLDGDFLNSLKLAVESDPRVVSARKDYNAQLASIDLVQGDNDFQVSGTLYGGVEDVTDEVAGMALVLNARKLLYDGGILEKSISAEQAIARAAYQNLLLKMNETAYEAAAAWVELERFKSLNSLIDSRLGVLDPLITQLEKVAEAGVGDKTHSRSTKNSYNDRVAQSDLMERLELAKVDFKNLFGALPDGISLIHL